VVDNEPIIIKLEGVAFNNDTYEPLPNTRLTFKDVDDKFENYTITTDENGYYSTILNQGLEIFIKAQKEKYFADAAVVNTKTITTSKTVTQDFYLKPIPPSEIAIEGIAYDFNSDKLRPASLIELNKIFEFLQLNDNLEISVNSHTDTRGSDAYNKKLSQRRAQSCVTYLISLGLDSSRIIANGFGEEQPNLLLDSGKKPVLDENGSAILLLESYINSQLTEEKKEFLHQLNRRTSFKVTGENFEMESK
jgi:outer membrane protein OmpA-like peptidoglycan-associated protein